VGDEHPGDPYAVAATYHAAISYIRGGAPEFAISVLDRLISAREKTGYEEGARLLRAYSHIDRKNWNKVREEYENFIRDFPASPYRTDAQKVLLKLEEKDRLPRKYPALAGTLSLVPGLGQLYCEREVDALQSFLLNGIFGSLAYYAWFSENRYGGERKNYSAAIALTAVDHNKGQLPERVA
jgi:hypothetical protein